MNRVKDNPIIKMKLAFSSNTTSNAASRKVTVIICTLFILSFIGDIMIRCTSIPYWHVSNDYIGIVFGGLCTVAALGSAIQSIVIGDYSNKILGFSVRELANFGTNKIRIRRTVCLSLSSVVIAIPALALNFCSTVSMITVIVVAYMAYSSVQVWQLLSDVEYEKDLVKNEVQARGAVVPELFYNAWFLELKDAIIANDITRQNTYIQLIKDVVDKCEQSNVDTSNVLAKYLSVAFNAASFCLGFVDAYNRVLCLNAPREQMKADLDSIIWKYIEAIQHCETSSIHNYQIANTIDDIFENLDTEDFIKIRYVYRYYQSVVNNSIISEEVRYQIIGSVIEKLCYLRNNDTGETRGKVLLYIAKYGIFENESENNRKKITTLIVKSLFNENRLDPDECYWSVVSQLFRGLYFYSIYETETLSPDYRVKLAKLYNYGDAGKNNYKVTLSNLIDEQPEPVIKWLTNDAIYYSEQYHIFDYFPNNSCCKTSIWLQENLLHFSFFIYSIFGYEKFFPAAEIINDKKVNICLKQKICAAIVALSNANFQFNEHAILKLQEMQNFLGNSSILPDQYFVDNFKFFNENLSDIITKQNQDLLTKTSANAKKLFEELVPLFDTYKPFKYNPKILLDNGKHIRLLPYLRKVTEKDTKYSAKRKFEEVRIILNSIISEALPVEVIRFDLLGVKKLLELIQNKKYLFRNYKYSAINKDIGESEDYVLLQQAISDIPYIHTTPHLNHSVFLSQQTIEFNISIIVYNLDLPTSEQCGDFIKDHKIAEGKYRIDGVIHDFAGAIKYVQENYRSESSEICIVTNITKDSGFKVKYK